MIVLGLETSCDETGLALYDSELGLRGQVLYSQIKLHAEYGGVVPELASRDHVRKLIPLMNQLLEQSGVTKQEIDAVLIRVAQGLMGALMTGALFGRTLAFSLNKPAIGVHHMEGICWLHYFQVSHRISICSIACFRWSYTIDGLPMQLVNMNS